MRLLFIFLLFGVALGNVNELVSKGKELITANLNDYIDTIIPALRLFLGANGFDPMPIPDLTEGFSAKPLLITYHGELELTKGKLTGLTSLARTGDFTVTYINKLLRIKGDFGFKNLGFTYNYLAKIMNIGPTGGVVGKVTKLGGVADFLIDFNNNEIHLQTFYLHDVGKITVKLTGHILTDWLGNSIINVVTTLFKNVIVKVIENNLKDVIQDKLDEINSNMSGFNELVKFEKLAYEYQKFQSMQKNDFKIVL